MTERCFTSYRTASGEWCQLAIKNSQNGYRCAKFGHLKTEPAYYASISDRVPVKDDRCGEGDPVFLSEEESLVNMNEWLAAHGQPPVDMEKGDD